MNDLDSTEDFIFPKTVRLLRTIFVSVQESAKTEILGTHKLHHPPSNVIQQATTATTDITMRSLLVAILLQGAQGFYLPGVNPYSFSAGEL